MIASTDPAAPRTAPCPICGKPASSKHLPFCSTRCRNIDLGRWLKGSYRVETDEGPDEHDSDDR